MAPTPTFYNVLDLGRGASLHEIVERAQTLAEMNGPDECPGNPEKAERHQRIMTAWEVLGDPELRRDYDAFLNSGGDTAEFLMSRQLAEELAVLQAISEWQVCVESVAGHPGPVVEGEQKGKRPTKTYAERPFMLLKGDGYKHPVEVPRDQWFSLTDLLMIQALREANQSEHDGVWNVYEINESGERTGRLLGRVVKWQTHRQYEPQLFIQVALDSWIPQGMRDKELVIRGSRNIPFTTQKEVDDRRVSSRALINIALLPSQHGEMWGTKRMGMLISSTEDMERGKDWALRIAKGDNIEVDRGVVLLPKNWLNKLGLRAWAWEAVAELVEDWQVKEAEVRRETRPITTEVKPEARVVGDLNPLEFLTGLIKDNMGRRGAKVFAQPGDEWNFSWQEPVFRDEAFTLRNLMHSLGNWADLGVRKQEGSVMMDFEAVLVTEVGGKTVNPETQGSRRER